MTEKFLGAEMYPASVANILMGLTVVTKSWGSYQDHLRTLHCVMKTLTIKPGQAISYQFHKLRSEFWVVENGTGEVWLDDEKASVHPGYTVHIPVEMKHKIINTSECDMIIREMQFGQFCSEDDIVRLDCVI